MHKKNIFVIGLDEWNVAALKQVPHAKSYRFHPLLSYQDCYAHETLDFHALLDQARHILAQFTGSIDGILTHWDFPCTSLLAVLAREQHLPAPSLEAILKCEHKYWARCIQKQALPEITPSFAPVNPFEPPDLDTFPLPFPFWLKPIKGFGSQLGFCIHDQEGFQQALGEMRGKIQHFGDAFNQAMSLANIPEDIAPVDGLWAIAESLVDGREIAPEGFVQNGNVTCHGRIDCVRYPNGKSFHRWEYPADIAPKLQTRIDETTETLIQALGYDQGCFNIEFFWDEPAGKLWVVEVNPRISQSHSYQFRMVNGISNHEAALEVALGREPAFPQDKGHYAVAAKCVLRKFEHARVRRIPQPADIQELEDAYPGCKIKILVEEGQDLDMLRNQDAYSFALAYIYVAGKDRQEMMDRYDKIANQLPFSFDRERPIESPQ